MRPYMKTCHYLSGFLFVMNDILVVLGVEKVCSAIKTVYNILAPLVVSNNLQFLFPCRFQFLSSSSFLVFARRS
jgi:hypothetical protein